MMVRLELKIEMEAMKRVGTFALSVADKAGLDEFQSQELHLVVEEAVEKLNNLKNGK